MRSAHTWGVRTAAALSLLALLVPTTSAAAATAGTPGGLAAVTYAVKDAPAEGFTDLTFPITVLTNTDPKASWFWADQVEFVGDRTQAYVGLQPNGDKGQTALFSVFGAGTKPVGATCKAGADAGAGSSCHLAYPWKTGRTYRFTMFLGSRNPTVETWIGSVTDATTKTTTKIGSWTVPNSRGLVRPATGFAEYFGKVASCAAIPAMSVRYDAPSLTSVGRHFPATVTRAYGYGSTGHGFIDCRAVARTSSTAASALVRAGTVPPAPKPTTPAPSVTSAPPVPLATSAAPAVVTPTVVTPTVVTPAATPSELGLPLVPPTQDQPTAAPTTRPVASDGGSNGASGLPVVLGALLLVGMAGMVLLRLGYRR